jgi:hypothetical protein
MIGDHQSLIAYREKGLLPDVDPQPPGADSDAEDHALRHVEGLGVGERSGE